MSLSQNPSPPRPAPIARGRAAIGRRTRLASVRCSLSKASAPATSTGVWDSDLLRWSPKTPPPRATAPPGLPPIVVLPGFGNNSGDYIAPFGDADGSLSSQLSSRGWRVYVVPLERGDWFNVARSLLTLRFWSSTLTTHPGYTWYLDRVHETVRKALAETGSKQVDLVGHSAGGWLARAYTADPKYYEEERAAAPAAVAAAEAGQADSAAGKAAAGTAGADAPAADSSPVASVDNAPAATGAGKLLAAFSRLLPGSGGGGARPVVSGGGSSQAGRPPRPNPTVRSIVTLGTPQRPPPPGKGVRDMTGGALGWVDRTYPGAFFADQGVTYVCVAGRSVRGNSNASRRQQQQQQGDGAAASPSRGSAAAGAGSGSGSSRRSPPEYAAGSYVQVCGEGEGVEGDAVVPVASAHLPGARVNLLLDGVWHSMSRLGTYGEASVAPWYGSAEVVDWWLAELVDHGR